MNAAQLTEQLLAVVSDLRASMADLYTRSREFAEAEKNYKRAKATAYLASHGTVAEREAHAEEAVNEARYKRDMAEGLKQSALEATRGNRAILSAFQSLAALTRAEAELANYGPEGS